MNDETQRLYGYCSYNNIICMISDLLFSFFMIKNAVLKKQHTPRADKVWLSFVTIKQNEI